MFFIFRCIIIPYFEYSGKQIFYQLKDNSSKNLLILIHGAGGNSNVWENQFYLKINYNIIAIDLPSHNKSNNFSELSLDLYVDVVKKLVETLNPKKLILGGHSMGGVVGQEYYFRNPNDVSALILCATGGRMRVSQAIFDSIKPDFQKYIKSFPIGTFYKKTSKDIIENAVFEVSQVNPDVIYRDFKICDAFDTLDKTNSIEIPCLIICGKYDELTPVKYSQFFHDKIKNSELYIIDKAGHGVMLEKPKKVNQAIEKFIENQL
ncbi:MAG: alpha/beta fold hydrolase [Candidatus Hermodarchaeota archaeon]